MFIKLLRDKKNHISIAFGDKVYETKTKDLQGANLLAKSILKEAIAKRLFDIYEEVDPYGMRDAIGEYEDSPEFANVITLRERYVTRTLDAFDTIAKEEYTHIAKLIYAITKSLSHRSFDDYGRNREMDLLELCKETNDMLEYYIETYTTKGGVIDA